MKQMINGSNHERMMMKKLAMKKRENKSCIIVYRERYHKVERRKQLSLFINQLITTCSMHMSTFGCLILPHALVYVFFHGFRSLVLSTFTATW